MNTNFFKDKEKLYYLCSGIIFFVAVILFIYFLQGEKNIDEQNIFSSEQTVTTTLNVSDCPYKSALNGECVLDESKQWEPLVGVMIENFTDARPQAGIADAVVVYEAPAEGNITRFLAFFRKDSDIPKVGPVRSARSYYLDFLSEYPGAMYMHVGGSPEALEKLSAYEIFDVNEFYRGNYFWRDEKKFAPHNVFTSSDLWKSVYEKYAQKNVNLKFSSWNFSLTTSTCSENCFHRIEIPFLRPSYVTVWNYNAQSKMYDRFQSNTPHLDSSGNLVRANTIIVQHVTDKILDDVGRRALGTIGSGKAEVYAFGNKIEGTWKKETRTSRTRFLKDDGTEIPLAPGKIWVEVVPQNIEVKN